jgi:hypothetical protein
MGPSIPVVVRPYRQMKFKSSHQSNWEYFVDGKKIASGTNEGTLDKTSTAKSSDSNNENVISTSVLAFKVTVDRTRDDDDDYNNEDPFFIAEIRKVNHGLEDTVLKTDESWKCSYTETDGWNNVHFDDSAWEAPNTQKNKPDSCGPQETCAPDFRTSAEWIWVSASEELQNTIYCRLTLIKTCVGSPNCAVDGDFGTYWEGIEEGGSGDLSQVSDRVTFTSNDFPTALYVDAGVFVTACRYSVRVANDGTASSTGPKSWTLLGRNNEGGAWTLVDKHDYDGSSWSDGEVRSFAIASPFPFRYYKFDEITSMGSNGILKIAELSMQEARPTLTTSNIGGNLLFVSTDYQTSVQALNIDEGGKLVAGTESKFVITKTADVGLPDVPASLRTNMRKTTSSKLFFQWDPPKHFGGLPRRKYDIWFARKKDVARWQYDNKTYPEICQEEWFTDAFNRPTCISIECPLGTRDSYYGGCEEQDLPTEHLQETVDKNDGLKLIIEDDTDYVFKVRAWNARENHAAKHGEWSDYKNVRTKKGVAGAF